MSIVKTDFDIIAKGAATRRPTLSLDVPLYDSYLSESDLGEPQKAELLQSLWTIIVGFVDLGFAVEPAAGTANRLGSASEEFASAGFALVDSSPGDTSNQFEKAAASEKPTGI